MALTFSIPEDYNVPAGVKEGVEFSDIATFKFDGSDMMILTVGEDKTPILSRHAEKKSEKPKGAKQAIKEQLASMEDKKGSAKIEDTETPEEEAAPEEEMD
jgi:hypothetical protein